MKPTELEKYYPLIHKITNKFPHQYRGDLFNELYIALYDILDRYDESRGQFQSFAYKRLQGHAIDYMRANQLNGISLDKVLYEDGEEVITGADLLESDDNFEAELILKDYVEQSEKSFTEVERFIRKKFREGESVEEITRRYYDYHEIKSKTTIRAIINK